MWGYNQGGGSSWDQGGGSWDQGGGGGGGGGYDQVGGGYGRNDYGKNQGGKGDGVRIRGGNNNYGKDNNNKGNKGKGKNKGGGKGWGGKGGGGGWQDNRQRSRSPYRGDRGKGKGDWSKGYDKGKGDGKNDWYNDGGGYNQNQFTKEDWESHQFHSQWNPNNPDQFGDLGYHMDPYEIPYDQDPNEKKKKGDQVEVRADYSQEFVDTGERPQNFLRDVPYNERYLEYPKLQRLMELKDEVIKKRATPPVSLKADLRTLDLRTLGKFDAIIIDPPWEEYQNRVADTHVRGEDLTPWTLDEVAALRIQDLAAPVCFVFIWCGVAHLEQARILFKRWGFRRCEDICWVKTNKKAAEEGNASNVTYDENSILVRTKEHCLMGIRGNVKRANDTDLIHANCDTDIIIADEPSEPGSTEKPEELYGIIEHFCLARRRIELFGLDRNIRDGWVTVGKHITRSNWNRDLYHSWFQGDKAYPDVQDYRGGRLLGSITEIEKLRPKSPPREMAMLTDGTEEGKGGKKGGKKGRKGKGKGKGNEVLALEN